MGFFSKNLVLNTLPCARSRRLEEEEGLKGKGEVIKRKMENAFLLIRNVCGGKYPQLYKK
jgi:hypothetical protein